MIATQASTSFMDLPPELRNTIYEMALCRRDGRSLDLINICLGPGGHRAALSRVNRVIHQESSSILYGANTFEIKIDIMTVPPHSQMPNLSHTLGTQSSYAIQWLKSIGASSAKVKCLMVSLRTDTPPLRLLRNLLNAARSSGNAVWTAHQAVLQVLGLLGLGVADEAFKIRVASVNSRHSQAAKDLYESAGISGNELYSVPLLRRLRYEGQ